MFIAIIKLLNDKIARNKFMRLIANILKMCDKIWNGYK